MKVNRQDFMIKFKQVLTKLGLDEIKIGEFAKKGSTLTLRDFNICNSVSIVIDTEMLNIYPDYTGCLLNETFEDIWNNNSKAINNL